MTQNQTISLLASAIACAIAVALIAWFGVFHSLHEWLSIGQTTGSIYVSGPQVYTRERLVNDRYREDSWLIAELDASSKQIFGPTASSNRSEKTDTTIYGQVNKTTPTVKPEATSDAREGVPAAKVADATANDELKNLFNNSI
jgi:hypothetical protein